MKTDGENLIEALITHGYLQEVDRENLLNFAKEVSKPDYIPNDKGVARKVKEIHLNKHGYRCGCQTGNDIQSGPIYCGRPAYIFAFGVINGEQDKNLIVPVCKSHENRLFNLCDRDEVKQFKESLNAKGKS